jgi:peptide/nickel transport system substrate-binding protein
VLSTLQRRQSLIGLGLALVALLLSSACSGSKQTSQTLVYAQPEDPRTLDPVNTDIAEAVHVITNVFDTLVTYHDEKVEIVPALAEKWETSPDGLTWTFHLRQGVLFHDGTPFTSAAVKLSLERLIADKHPLRFDEAVPYKQAFAMLRSVDCPDDHTVVLHLNSPSAILLPNLAMFSASIVSPAALEKSGKSFASEPVGTGPFRFVRWNRDQQLVLAGFEQHWRGAPKLKNLIIIPVKENATRVQKLERGEIQLADSLTPSELDQLAKNPQLITWEKPGMNVTYLSFQVEQPPLDNLKVREAIWMAIDKARLIQVAYYGHAQPAVSMVPPSMWGHDPALKDRPFDPAAARKLLAEAAAEANFTLPLKLKLSVMAQARPYLPDPAAAAGLLKDSLREIGVEVEVEPRDVNQHFQYLMAGKHQLGLAGWFSDNSDPDNFLYSLLDPDNISDNGNNLSRFRDAKFHELLLAGQKELDVEKRLALYHQAQQIAFQQAPTVPLAHTNLKGCRLPPPARL